MFINQPLTRKIQNRCAFVVWVLCGCSLQAESAEQPLPVQAWNILSRNCLRCHNAEKTRGGLDISSREAALQGGATSDALVPGEPEKSALWLRAKSGTMPPERDGEPLKEDDIHLLEKWIRAGGAWPKPKQ